METIRLLVADDNPGVRFVVGTMARGEPALELVAEAENGEDAVAKVREHRPDVVVLDVSMPVLDGISALPLILEVAPDCRVVMYSAVSDRRTEALEAGAHGWVTKGESLTDLRDHILAAARGDDDPPAGQRPAS